MEERQITERKLHRLLSVELITHPTFMKTRNIIVISVTLLVICSACGKKEATTSNPKNTTEQKSDVVDVATLDKEGDKELAETNKVAEARQWLRARSHSIFKGDQQSVIKFVDEFYAAGAVTVYVTGIDTLGGTQVTETMLLVLPKEAAARAKVFEVANRFDETIDSDPEKDIGQKYLSFVLD
jgi:hypothetical protein